MLVVVSDPKPIIWMQPEKPTRGPTPTHSRKEIAAVAIKIADAEGLEAASVRSIARNLGSGAMTLYRYLPTKEDLVLYLNTNSANMPGIQSDDVTLTCYQGNGIGIPVGAQLRCQGPRNFRLRAKALGNDEVDLGSNNDEFWYWIRRGDKFQVFCSYQALESGQVKQMPFPFQPDWVMEAMGLGRYGPADKYELAVEKVAHATEVRGIYP